MNKISWPTTFLFSVIILGIVFIYGKPVTLTSNTNNAIIPSGEQVWQLRDGQVRKCYDVEQYGSPRTTSYSQWSRN